MEQINLLIVEDEESAVNSFKSALEDFPQIDVDIAYNLDETVKYLSNKKEYQIIIVDLKLGQDDDEYKGNYILNLLKKHKKCVIALHSGNVEENDDDENDFFKRYKRGDIKIKDMISDLIDDYNNLKLEIDFYNYVEDTLVKEVSSGNLDEIKGKTDQINPNLNEYYSLLLEHIVFSKDEEKSKKINGNLMYIPKNLITKHYPGCIYQKDDKFYFLITPACDMAKNNTSKLHFIECFTLEEYLKTIDTEKYFNILSKKSGKIATEDEIKNNCELTYTLKSAGNKKIEDIKVNPKKNKSVYVLPKGLFLEHDIVLMLHNIKIFEQNEFSLDEVKCQLIARVTKDIVNRFGALFGNQGSPDFTF